MNRKVLYYSLDRLKDEPTEVYVNTNLSQLIGSRDIERLRNVDCVLVSFPSYRKKRFNQIVGANSFNKVLANLETLVQEGISVGINQVVTPTNYNEVIDTVKFLKERIRLKEFSASPVLPTCSNSNNKYSIKPEQVLKLASQLIDIETMTGVKTDMLTFIPPCFFPDKMMHHRLTAHGCSAGRDSVIIGATGNVRRCALLEKSYGNIREEELKTIWERIQNLEKPVNEKCNSCMPYEYCSGGCESRANISGGIDPYVMGLTQNRKNNFYVTPSDSTVLTSGRIMYREESDKFLIGHGGTYVIGNEALLKFVKNIEGKKFSFLEVKRDLGETGTKLITYLFNRGLLKECASK